MGTEGMRLELSEEEVTELHRLLGDEELRALDRLGKATDYQFHDEMKKWRRRIRFVSALRKRLLVDALGS